MSIVELDEYEKEIVRYLAKQFNEGNRHTNTASWPRAEEVGERANKTCSLFVGMKWLYWNNAGPPFARKLLIDRVILEVAHELDNPPPVDHWKNLLIWFRSKWWSLPVLVAFIGIPSLWQWVEMLRGILEWLGIVKP